jgi:hypothetical protein
MRPAEATSTLTANLSILVSALPPLARGIHNVQNLALVKRHLVRIVCRRLVLVQGPTTRQNRLLRNEAMKLTLRATGTVHHSAPPIAAAPYQPTHQIPAYRGSHRDCRCIPYPAGRLVRDSRTLRQVPLGSRPFPPLLGDTTCPRRCMDLHAGSFRPRRGRRMMLDGHRRSDRCHSSGNSRLGS